jgi:hypothetical protein
MKTIEIYKASGLGQNIVESFEILIDKECPSFVVLATQEDLYDLQAKRLSTALSASLPQAVLDRVIGHLMLERASLFIMSIGKNLDIQITTSAKER